MGDIIDSDHDFLVTEEHLHFARIIWDFLLMKHELKKSDAIIVFGNCDTRTAEHASALFLQGWADWLAFAGYRGNSTPVSWTTEAEMFKGIAVRMGVPECKIIMENESRNTGENVAKSYSAMKNHDIEMQKLIIVQMPFMERRVYATVMKQWPGNVEDVQVLVTSPPIKLEDYPTKDIGTLSEVIAKMVGCLQRVIDYPALGFHIYQKVNEEVWSAYNELVKVKKYRQYLYVQKRE